MATRRLTPASSTTPLRRIELPIEGMTCASCVARIEQRLNGLDGVVATVNLATETATVELDPGLATPESLVEAVEQAGYEARLPAPRDEQTVPPATRAAAALRTRLVVSAVLSVPVVVLAMVSSLQFDYWQWVSLALATPVVFWGGWPFHRASVLEPPAPRGHDGHADLARHALRVGLVGRRASLPGRRGAGAPDGLRPHAGRPGRRGALPGGRGRRHDAHPARPLSRGSRQDPRGQRDPGAPGSRSEGGARDARRCRDHGSRRAAARRRSLRRSAGREARRRRHRRGGNLRGRPVDADRRVASAGGRTRRGSRGRHDQHLRPPRRSCDSRRLRDGSRPDRAPRRAGPERQGAGPAARRPCLGRLRARRHPRGGRDARDLARHGRGDRVRILRRRQRARDRLPVRARSRYADRADGRNRQRSAAGHPHQGPGVARADTPHRHGPARQDGNSDRGPHATRRRPADERGRRTRGAACRRRGRERERAPDRTGRDPGRTRASG